MALQINGILNLAQGQNYLSRRDLVHDAKTGLISLTFSITSLVLVCCNVKKTAMHRMLCIPGMAITVHLNCWL